MTEYWVSQGHKWCEFCRIYIANNAVSIKSHELGQKHKDNVAKKVAKIHKDTLNKEKEEQKALKELEQIEAKAVRSYQNDIAVSNSNISAPTLTSSKINESATTRTQATYSGKATISQSSDADDAKVEWFKDTASGYQFNPATGHYFDPKSGFYYSEVLGQWTTEEEALKAAKMSKEQGGTKKTPITGKALTGGGSESKPGPPVKGRASSLAVNASKRKREYNKHANSSEEARARAEREAARKRVEERDKATLGLYQAYSRN